MEITYEEPHTPEEDENVVATLAQASGVLRSRHGDRLVVLYGRDGPRLRGVSHPHG
jgi:hypothetical protein